MKPGGIRLTAPEDIVLIWSRPISRRRNISANSSLISVL
jgi:hypothetical protein